jgi:hypothetical protein
MSPATGEAHMENLKAWLQQPTSVAGLATISGTISALLTHQITTGQAIPLFSAAFVSIIVRDNSAPSKTGATATLKSDGKQKNEKE